MATYQKDAAVAFEIVGKRLSRWLATTVGGSRGTELRAWSRVKNSALVRAEVASVGAVAADIDIGFVAHLKAIREGGVMLHDVSGLSGRCCCVEDLQPQSEDDLDSSGLS